ncbi:MAG: hypothetical protein JF587_13490 [Catenulisporales bacterium]|nr:hypothetical protein [Catenulisporales bacterium]
MRFSPPDGAGSKTAGSKTLSIEACVTQAKAAAGNGDILLRGAADAQKCLRASLLDEMEVQSGEGAVPHLRYRARQPIPWTK